MLYRVEEPTKGVQAGTPSCSPWMGSTPQHSLLSLSWRHLGLRPGWEPPRISCATLQRGEQGMTVRLRAAQA